MTTWRALFIVTMIQTTESGDGDCPAPWTFILCGKAANRGLFLQAKMRPVLVVVTDILTHEPFQVLFIQNDYMIEQVATQFPTQCSATPFCQGLHNPF
jgi:hypothetical protein